jgi:ATP-dependent RNA circularization protein (DNA/RNA ligase family)
MRYPKIQTLWKRDEKTGLIILGDYSKDEFDSVDTWMVTEKIDGTNIRVIWEEWDYDPMHKVKSVTVEGRTDKAQIPQHLHDFLQGKFTEQLMKEVFPDSKKVVLFGEGYGHKIQSAGSRYLGKDVGFILFDVWVDGWWLERKSIEDIAEKIGIPCVPRLGLMTKKQIEDFVMSEPMSIVSKERLVMEGVVCTSAPMMLFRNGEPLRFKLKVSDYRKVGKLDGQTL